MIYDTTEECWTAKDLRTVTAAPLTPYCLGWNDAYYQDVYYCPYGRDTQAAIDYRDGHVDGKEARAYPAAVGG